MSDPYGGNFYPITCKAYIQDTKQDAQLTLLVDRTRGGSSLESGQFEIMIHRRDVTTDNKGPLVLDDTDHLARMKFCILFDTINQSATIEKQVQYRQQFPPTLFFASTNGAWKYRTSFSSLKQDFPANVHLLSLKFWEINNDTDVTTDLLVRVAHIYEAFDPTPLAKPVTIDLNDYFNFSPITMLEERSLTAVWKINEMNRWNWSNPQQEDKTEELKSSLVDPSQVSLQPTQVRTFFAQY